MQYGASAAELAAFSNDLYDPESVMRDAVLEKASVVWCWDSRRWLELRGSDGPAVRASRQ